MSTSTLPSIDEFRSTLQSTGVQCKTYRVALWVSLSFAALVAGCGDDDTSDGGLAVIVETDLSLPKDLDNLTFEVWQDGQKLPGYDGSHPLGRGQFLIPAEFRVRPMGDTDKPVLIRAIGWKGLVKRVERSVITTVPSDYLAMVRLPLSYLCVGKARDDGSSTCGDGQTCRAGLCESAQIDPTTLPVYENGPWTGAETSTRDPSLHDCFDAVTCFAQGSRVTLDPDACTFTLEAEDTSNISLGIKLQRGSDGICGAAWCWIALDEGPEGWTQQAGLFTLPRALCLPASDGSRLAIVATNTCGSKTPLTPSCDEGSAATHPSDTSETIGITSSNVMETPGNPIGRSCGGLSFQECGACGQQRRTCRDGNWDVWGECLGEGICTPNTSESCGASGMRICSNTCEWGECTGDSCPGSAVEACGNCGTRRRTCTDGAWSAWGACEAEGACEPNTTRACPEGGMQACLGSCQWGVCGTSDCLGAPQQACGNCGTQSRQCDATAMTWSAFGACGEEGACEANQTRACGSRGIQTCGGACQWDAACAGQLCEGPASMPCGLCGIQTRTCDNSTGAWSVWSACRNEGVCAPESAEGCGAGGARVCLSSCQWSEECIGQSCVGPMTQSCGFCGTESRICDGATGQWLPSFCTNEGPCNPGSTRRCGADNTGTRVCTNECQWDLACDCPTGTFGDNNNCGSCGAQCATGTPCVDGICQNIDECARDIDNCSPNATCTDTRESFTCACNNGYEGNGVACTDINECNLGRGSNCSPNATCMNTPGSFRCDCNNGYQGDGVRCTDIDECASGNGGCSADATCANTLGGRTCTCKPGFVGNGTTCTADAVNECTNGTHNCSSNATCTDTAASFSCACNAGFSGDGVQCTDIDECTSGNGGCSADATCANTLGGRTCTCKPGFVGNGTSCTAEAVNECTNGTHNCSSNATCTDTAASFSCACNAGFSGDGVQCTDIDECASGNGGCSADATCANTLGGRTCTCKPGFVGNGTSCTAEAVNECTNGTHNCSSNATCTDTAASFSCACNAGFSGDGVQCTDIDECASGNGGCSADATCANTLGGRTCTCKPGFVGNGTSCTAEAVNECTNGTHNCSPNANCTDTPNSFTCSCKDDYEGDGVTCTSTLVNECTNGTHNCSPNASCTDTSDSFSCACNSGYDGNGVTCTDVNECSTGQANCAEGATCVNTPGSFRCDAPSSPG